MKTYNNTILITGGATGLGLALTEVFLQHDNCVIICGRRKEKLIEAQGKFPEVHIKVCDVAIHRERQALFEWVTGKFPELNILINNAGIQRQMDFSKGMDKFMGGEDEITINFSAPVHLCGLFMPHLMKQTEAAIVNVSSGLGFVPLTIMPVYCATKAALHSFSWSLRHQLRKTNVRVFEVIPPTVDTELDRGARKQRRQEYRGVPSSEVAEAALTGMAKEEFEIVIGQAQGLFMLTRKETELVFQRMNGSW